MICRYKMPNSVFRSLLVFPNTVPYLYLYLCSRKLYARAGLRADPIPKLLSYYRTLLL